MAAVHGGAEVADIINATPERETSDETTRKALAGRSRTRGISALSRTWNVAGIGLGFVILALMAHFEASVRWMIVTLFVFGALSLNQTIKDAAIWIEARVEEVRRA